MTLRQTRTPLIHSAKIQIGRPPGKPRAVISHPGFYHERVSVQPFDGNVWLSHRSADNVVFCELPMLEASRLALVTDRPPAGRSWAILQLTRCDVHHSPRPGGDAGLDARASTFTRRLPRHRCRRALSAGVVGGHLPESRSAHPFRGDRDGNGAPSPEAPRGVPWPMTGVEVGTTAHSPTVQPGIGSGVSPPGPVRARRAVLRRVEAPIRIADRGFDLLSSRAGDPISTCRSGLCNARTSVVLAISRRNRRPMAGCRGKRRRSRRPRSAGRGWQGLDARRRRGRHRSPRCRGRTAGHRSSRCRC